jgi:hypothetical protein
MGHMGQIWSNMVKMAILGHFGGFGPIWLYRGLFRLYLAYIWAYLGIYGPNMTQNDPFWVILGGHFDPLGLDPGGCHFGFGGRNVLIWPKKGSVWGYLGPKGAQKGSFWPKRGHFGHQSNVMNPKCAHLGRVSK